MIAHKEAFLRGDEGLANDLQWSTYIQGIGLMHTHPWMLIKTGMFAQSFASFHELSSSLSSAKNRGLAATKSGGWSRRDRGGVVSGGAPCGCPWQPAPNFWQNHGVCSYSSKHGNTHLALLRASAFRHGDIAPGE